MRRWFEVGLLMIVLPVHWQDCASIDVDGQGH
jgi:hypothetical protein